MSIDFKTDWKPGDRGYAAVNLGKYPDTISEGSSVDILSVDSEKFICTIQGDKGIILQCGMDCLKYLPRSDDLYPNIDFLRMRVIEDSKAVTSYYQDLKAIDDSISIISETGSNIIMHLMINPSGKRIQHQANIDADPEYIPAEIYENLKDTLLQLLYHKKEGINKKIAAIQNRYKSIL